MAEPNACIIVWKSIYNSVDDLHGILLSDILPSYLKPFHPPLLISNRLCPPPSLPSPPPPTRTGLRRALLPPQAVPPSARRADQQGRSSGQVREPPRRRPAGLHGPPVDLPAQSAEALLPGEAVPGGGSGQVGALRRRGAGVDRWVPDHPQLTPRGVVVPLTPDELLPCLQPRTAWLLPTLLALPSSCSRPTLSLSPPP